MEEGIIEYDAEAKTLTIRLHGVDWPPVEAGFHEGERSMQALQNRIGRTMTKALMRQYDQEREVLLYEGQRYYLKDRTPGHYQSLYGPITLERPVYQCAQGGATYCPLEAGCGLKFGSATPLLAQVLSFKLSAATTGETRADLRLSHGLTLSADMIRQTVARAATPLSQERLDMAEAALPPVAEVAVLACGLDGTTMPLVGEGYKEAMAGTFAFYNAQGQRITTHYLGTMPEEGKATFCRRFEERLRVLNAHYPKARLVFLADGAPFNWKFLDRIAPRGRVEILDFYHACEHLKILTDLLWPEASAEERRQIHHDWAHHLKHENNGIKELLNYWNGLLHLWPPPLKARPALQREIQYFQNNAHRMHYGRSRQQGLPIGSGVTEAACKTLLKARFSRSGMRWKRHTGDPILQLRAVRLSGQWEVFWKQNMDYHLHQKAA